MSMQIMNKIKLLMLMLTSVMLLFLGNRNAYSATAIYPVDFHDGWGWSASGSQEFWFYQPYYAATEVLELWRAYQDYTYPNPEQMYQGVPIENINSLLLNRIHYVTVFFPLGYVPTETNPQPSGMFRVECWTAGHGYSGVTLPTPPWIDNGWYLDWYPASAYHERVYAAAYCVYFLDNNNGGPPTIGAYLAGTLWAHPSNAPGYWSALNGLAAQMGINL